jgi:signal transduction histidine kinase
MNPQPTLTPGAVWRERWHSLRDGSVRAFHAYANWLVGISWRRFIVLSLLALIFMAIVHDIFNFSWRTTTEYNESPRRLGRVDPPSPPSPPGPVSPPAIRIQGDKPGEGVDISIGKDGIRIVPKAATAAEIEAAARDAEQAAAAAASAAERSIRIVVPPGTSEQAVQEALAAARVQIREQVQDAVREARQAVQEAAIEAEHARREAAEARRESAQLEREIAQLEGESVRIGTHTIHFGFGDFLMQFTVAWVVASALLKFTYKGTQQAQRQAARATETAEAESLKRQVVEARMAAMQAQVEPHFLFNTLASIDHLIETDPARASQMQRNLIALLRASMPTMREAAGGADGKGSNGVRDLGREIAVIRPYLEILKVRMEERLTTELAVPAGLMSAEFPPMMLQTLVENAIKHGLEPKAEGGHLRVAAEIVHGKLQMTVADTGLGFGKAATAGTGVGLANIRERLQLLYGNRASLTVAENQPSGTVVTITVPYKPVEEAMAA